MTPMSATCLYPCDPDCDAACHQDHVVAWRRDPAECARCLAGDPENPFKETSDMTASEIQPGHALVLLTVGDIAHIVTALHPPTAPLKVPAARIAAQAGLPESEVPGRRFIVATLSQEDADGFTLLDDPRA